MILNLKNTNKKMKVGLMSLAATALFFLPTLANADSYTVKSGDQLSLHHIIQQLITLLRRIKLAIFI